MPWNDNLDVNSPAYNFAIDRAKALRVVAGPGTGKSFALRRRVARLLEEGANPERILAVTFTRTAAQDLKTEISAVGVEGADRVTAKTLHSFCFSILNKRSLIESTGRYPRPMLEHELKPMLYDIGDNFGGLREKEKTLRAFEAIWARLQSETPGFIMSDSDRAFERNVMEWLNNHKAMLFGEMIRETYKYLRDNPLCLERQMFDHVLVDEYQDLNKAEQVVIDYLATNADLAIIGDDDQSIYSFKHAHPEGIREFPETHNHCESIEFSQCRRCPKAVVNMASKLISNNTNRTLGNLVPYEENDDGVVKIVQFNDLASEINGISNFIKKQVEESKIHPQDALILVPVSKIGYRIRNTLISKGVNAVSYFRESALKTPNAKKIFSLLNIAARPHDLVALRYLLGCGVSDYRKNSYKRVLDYAREHNKGILSVLEELSSGQISMPHTRTLIARYIEIRNEVGVLIGNIERNRLEFLDIVGCDGEECADLRNVISSAIDEVGLMEDSPIQEWLDKLYSLVVEGISFPQTDHEEDHVRIMSLHASKGLNAKLVVIMSCIDELLPRIDQDLTPEERKNQLEEQRRLFYVAITRCKSSPPDYPGTLIISSFVGLPGNEALQIKLPATPTTWRTVRASRFISEFEETAPKTVPIR